MTPCLAIHTNHDSSIAVRDRDGNYRVVEMERLAERYYILSEDFNRRNWILSRSMEQAAAWADIKGSPVLSNFGTNDHIIRMLSDWGHPMIQAVGHHDAHAACAFYLSPYEKASVITYDGGGYEPDGSSSSFVFYDATREGGCVRRASIPLNLGENYINSGELVDAIAKSPIPNQTHRLSWPGKMMALAAYGTPAQGEDRQRVIEYLSGNCRIHDAFEPFRRQQFDFCSTVQDCFEQIVVEQIIEWTDKSLPLCIGGGCALNVRINQKIRDLGYDVFVPPNPNDCGLTLGMLLAQDRPKDQVDCTFNGLPWPGGEESYPEISLAEVAHRLIKGQIIGFIEGDSEIGPRALGHRSILCKGSLSHARARLNAIKGREWYRPVSPVIRLGGYQPSPFMSFAPSKWEGHEWVHVDGTARVQTVTDESQCHGLWELCHLLDEPIINTSLNAKGRPICNDMEHAISILTKTELNCLVINGRLIEK